MKKTIFRFVAAALLLPFALLAQPINDDPCGAIELVANVGNSCAPTAPQNWSNATATQGIPAPNCASYSTGDVWFRFTLASASNIFLTTSEGVGANGIDDGGMAVYYAPTCNGPFVQVECDDDDGTGSMPQIALVALPAGQYWVRFWDYEDKVTANFGGICLATVAVMPDAPNDTPCDAMELPLVSADSCTPDNPMSWELATGTFGVPLPGCGSYSTGDIWFRFALDEISDVSISTLAGTGPTAILDGAMALYAASDCNSDFSLLLCNNNYGANPMPRISALALLPGTYFVRFWDVADKVAANFGGICVAAKLSVSIPALNDDPCGAIELTVESPIGCTPQNPQVWTNATASANIPPPSCGSYLTGDVWFKFVLSEVSDVSIVTSAGSGAGGITDGAMALYKADDCNNIADFLGCDDDGGLGSMPLLNVFSLPAGTYFIRFWDYEDKFSGNFGGICVSSAPSPSTAPNDLCINAIEFSPIPLDGNCANVTVNTTGAFGVPNTACGGIVDDDVWYTFSLPPNATRLNFTITQNGNPSTQGIQFFSGNCNQLASLGCFVDNEGLLENLIPGVVYYLRTYTPSNDDGAVYDLCLSVANGPANDEPCGAVVLPVAQSADCVANVPLSWNFASASEGLATPNCGSYLGGDVWFKFTLDFKADILVKTLAGIGAAGITDGAMELYAADGCDNLSLLICADDETPQIYMPQITFYALPAGDYYLRFWDYSDAISGNIGGICVAAQPSISVLDNDNCLGATAFSDIPLDGSCATVEVETGQATGNADDATVPGFPDDDVWFKFTVPVGGQNLYFELNTFSGNNQQALCFYNACGAPNPFLNITDRLEGKLQGFVEGNEYYIRAYTFEKEVSSHFSICLRVLQPPSNDLCINALDFPAIPADGNLATVAVNSFTAISSIASCHDAETGDVWYRFTVPANTSSLVARIEMADGSDDVAGFELFEGNCNNLTSLGCFSNYFSSGRLRMDGLMPGQSYFLLTYKFDENSQVPYQLSLAIPPPPPVNDVCLGAIPFPTIPTDGSCASVVANTLGATEDTDDACFFSVDDGVWFSFVMPIGYTKLLAQRTILSGSPFDEIIIYSGSCNSLNSISCHSQGEILINDLVGGETYYLQAHSMFLDDTTAYEICLKLLPNTSLPNDDCGAPIPFPPIPVSGDWVTVQGNTLGGTPSGLPPCNGYGEDDVWHKFAVPMGYDRLLYALEKVNSFNGAGVNMEIYAGACADPQFIGCYSTDNTGHISGLQGGQAYLMRIYSTGDNDYAQYEVSLRVPPPLLNDGCANALAFPPLPTNGTCVSLQAHTVFAEGTQTPPCPGAQDDDVWFKFVAPSDRTVVHYDVEVLSGNSILRTQLYKGGDCSSLLLQECSQTIVQFDTEDFSLLEPNATYYIRVFSNDANVSTEFDLCLSAGPLPPPNDSCHHATPITDAMGNFSDPGLQTLAGATHSNQPLCAQIGQGNLPFDVWYTFTTDSDGGDATIEVDGLGDLFTFGYFQLGIQAFSGGCGDLSTLWCGPAQDYLNDKGSFTLYGLLPSTEYLFRVFPITNTGGYAARLFNISAHGTALSPTIGWEDPNEMASAHLAIGKIIPNPADHQATVIYHAPQAAEYRLTVFDLMGRPIITQFAQSQVGENRCQLELRGFPSGLYTIQLSNSFQQATAMRFVKR